ncbi:ABC transporter ATP-binding protein [Streptobacillus moniliformis]|uniref:ABC transporter related protein n=3 Tax=Streptobacillus moniliformis TaxID=34105 RepID=D1AXB8_STRM9|nr:ABC transporter ATP-binding protein [Streptobacillus moniliformis]ACZ00944.1 ABC transporter related protein [Streptobacillus moniliformis DSM 12112]AVL42674.1 ABC transporter ATP-binding protein [Streptobacillus moniliformis]SQA13915.1 LIV-I protein F [Streptobacillus moniliformis]
MKVLEVNNINVFYDKIHAIKDVSFYINKGEIVSFIGANGAGKSTTLNAISNLLKIKSGEIALFGENISNVKAHKLVLRGMAHVPEGRRIFTELTVLENLLMGAFTRPKSEIKESLEKMFNLFPRLRERKNQLSGTMSGGEQQMLAMARALMSKPKLLLLDEPSMGLAPLLVKEIFEIIKKINKEENVTILLVEQNAKMSLEISDRAYVIETGEIILEGNGLDLIDNPVIKKAYLGG